MISKILYFFIVSWHFLLLTLQAVVQEWNLPVHQAVNMDRAVLWHEDSLPAKNGVLVLCLGMNGSGKGLVAEKPWVEFASTHGLGLVGLSFSSPTEKLYAKPGKGYYYAEQGSGDILLTGIDEIFGKKLKPEIDNKPKLLMFGFSGGAIFIANFVKWKPERVLAWSAYSASFWTEPTGAEKGPPGIVACGEFDSERYGPSFAYFQQGRRVEAPWIWLSLKNTGHMRNRKLEQFTRDFFADILAGKTKEPVFFDAERKTPVDENELLLQPAMTVWLPNADLAQKWQEIHHP